MSKGTRRIGAVLALVLLTSGPRVGGAGAGPVDTAADSLPASGLPVSRTHVYRMAGRIRPLLFWMGKDDVGLARVVWRGSPAGTRGYEFIVGTDPAKIPRGINRWGYIADEHDGGAGAVVAVMSRSDETSLGDVEKNQRGPGAGGNFRAMRASVDGALTRWQVAPVTTRAALTVHDVPSLLEQVSGDIANATVRSRPTPDGARAGFLIAVAELVDRAVAAHASGARPAGLVGSAVPYVFAQGSYELRFRSIEAAGLPLAGGRGVVGGWKGSFEILNLATRKTTTFEMSFGAEGALAGVPIAISWQPRWWLQVELYLADPQSGSQPAAAVASARPR